MNTFVLLTEDIFRNLAQKALSLLQTARERLDKSWPFDTRCGRVAVKTLRNLKTNAGGRVIPIHPLLIELGLLDRMQDLIDQGVPRLFLEREAYTRKRMVRSAGLNR